MNIALRRDVSWHDGKPFTPLTWSSPSRPCASTAPPRPKAHVWRIDKVTATDAHQVSLTFKACEASPEDKLHFKILPAPLRRHGGVPSHPFHSQPVGTGPYRLQSFNNDNSISIRAQRLSAAQRRRGAPDAGGGRQEVPVQAASYGSLEALVRVLPRDLAIFKRQSTELPRRRTPGGSRLQPRRQALRRPPRAGALALMVDRPSLLAPIAGRPARGPFVRSSPFYNHTFKPESPTQRAPRSCWRGGWRRVDGRWHVDGAPITLRLSALARQETVQDVVINLQSQLKQHGLHVRQDFMTTAEWKARVWGERDFDLILSQWSFDRNEDIYEQFHSSGNRNFVGFSDEKLDGLLDAARTTPDPQAKRTLLRDAHARVHDVNPMIFLWTLDTYAAMSIHVGNVTVHPFYFFTWTPNWTMQ